jgi:hypothetical protein
MARNAKARRKPIQIPPTPLGLYPLAVDARDGATMLGLAYREVLEGIATCTRTHSCSRRPDHVGAAVVSNFKRAGNAAIIALGCYHE